MVDLFKCSTCHCLDDSLYESDCCGVIFCGNCNSQLKPREAKCKRCGDLLNCRLNSFANRIVKSLNVQCKYNCGKVCPFQDMKAHLTFCPNREYTCTFDDCSFKGKKDGMMRHLVTTHDIYLLCLMEAMSEFEGSVIAPKKEQLKDFAFNYLDDILNLPLINNDEGNNSNSIHLTEEEQNSISEPHNNNINLGNSQISNEHFSDLFGRRQNSRFDSRIEEYRVRPPTPRLLLRENSEEEDNDNQNDYNNDSDVTY